MYEKLFPGSRLKISFQTPPLVPLFFRAFWLSVIPCVTHNRCFLCKNQSTWIFLRQLTYSVLLAKTCCNTINIKLSTNTCCTGGPPGNHVLKVYFMVKKQKNAAMTLQQNQTDLILLQCFCSIFLPQKLNLLQCLMGGQRQYLISMRSAALFCCV